jgi:anti-sigma factor RsiW
MNHETFQADLFEFYDGRLPAARRGEVSTHLAGCSACRAELDAWKQTAARLVVPLQMTGTEMFVQNVMRRVRAYTPELAPFRWREFTRWAFPALAFSLTACAAAFFYVLQPSATSTDSLLIGGAGSAVSVQWPSSPPTEDQLLPSAVSEQ